MKNDERICAIVLACGFAAWSLANVREPDPPDAAVVSLDAELLLDAPTDAGRRIWERDVAVRDGEIPPFVDAHRVADAYDFPDMRLIVRMDETGECDNTRPRGDWYRRPSVGRRLLCGRSIRHGRELAGARP